MTPARLGSFKATRLSFGPALMARAIRERWRINLERWNFDRLGTGVAVYGIDTPDGWHFTFVIDFRLRAYEEKYGDDYGKVFDGGGTLVEGPVSDAFIEDFRSVVLRMPFDGRSGHETLAWVRMNRSTRSFEETVAALAEGRQPNVEALCSAGYLLRGAQFHANGMCGMRLFSEYSSDHPLRHPFAPQALAAYLTREFGNDMVDYLAAQQGGAAAVRLHPAIKRYLGLGNGTGIGLIIFTRNHPRLIDRWIEVRETAHACATRREAAPDSPAARRFLRLLTRFYEARRIDHIPYGETFLTGPELATAMAPAVELAREFVDRGTIGGCNVGNRPWPALRAFIQNLPSEAEEAVNAALIDSYPDITDQLIDRTIVEGINEASPELCEVDVTMTVQQLRDVLRKHFAWAMAGDALTIDGRYWTWYWSTTGEYPGVLSPEELAETGSFAEAAGDIPSCAQRLDADLATFEPDANLATVLIEYPEHRATMRWIQTVKDLRYGAIRMNMRDRNFHPARPTRFMLEAMKGFERFQPTRRHAGGTVIFLQGAPMRHAIAEGTDDIWAHPVFPKL